MKWAYGVTTVPSRRNELLTNTLAHLKKSGFDKPRLFVDGSDDSTSWSDEFGLDITIRDKVIRTFGNWYLALHELFIREPHADRYAIFQDDISCGVNLREYLEHTIKNQEVLTKSRQSSVSRVGTNTQLRARLVHTVQKKVASSNNFYWNLYNVPANESLAPRDMSGTSVGWYESNQRGKGALGLIFNPDGVLALLTHVHMLTRQMDEKGWKSIDGGIAETMRKSGFKELVHNPSLVQHQGHISSMYFPDERRLRQANNYRGDNYDYLLLLSGKG